MEFGGAVDEPRPPSCSTRDRGRNQRRRHCQRYAGGRSEEIVGRLISSQRDRLILSTKFAVPTDNEDPNSGGTSRRTVIAACEASLRRLRTDYIDVYYIHRPFTQTAIDETLRALDDLVRAGKIRYVGSSGASDGSWWTCCGARTISGSHRPVVEQTAYRLLDRRAERDLVPAAMTHDTRSTVWSPLAGGLLTGKYVGQRPAAGARWSPEDDWGRSTSHRRPTPPWRGWPSGRARRCHPDGAQPGLDASAARGHQCRRGPRSTTSSPGCWLRSRFAVEDRGAGTDRPDRASRGVTVQYYLDDSFADFRPHPHRW